MSSKHNSVGTLLDTMMQIVCLWSGPRNVSTALMYSFAQRPDSKVVDEPLYGHYLRVSGASHPGREEIIKNMDSDGNAVMQHLLQTSIPQKQLLFVKHMAHHLLELDLRFLSRTKNAFLIRDPQEMLPSLIVQIPHATLADTGLARQWQLYQDLRDRGQSPAVIDSRELLLDPAGIIAAFCRHLGIQYYPGMLHWAAGPIDEDGIWAKHWYQSVHLSTGFSPYAIKEDFPERLLPLLDECRPYYEKLLAQAIRTPSIEKLPS